jgi:RNA polymerase sigma factor (sigma-70 family)
MAANGINGVILRLRRAALQRDAAGLTDGELLELYLAGRDEAAFEVLLRRHGAMVLGVCRRTLRNEADAEDAFQATFLVFVRKAASIRSLGTVSNWLYGVAHNTALKAKAMNLKRHAKEREAGSVPKDETSSEARQEVHALLDGVLSSLPDKYRIPIVLCDLEGKTIKEATRHLGWPQGTVATRLYRGRRQLAKRLTKQSLTLSGSVTAAVMSQAAAWAQATTSACVPASLVVSTVQAATAVAAGHATAAGMISTKVVALSERVVRAMLMTKLKALAIPVLAAVVLGGGALITYRGLGAEPRAVKQQVASSASSADDQRAKEAEAKEAKAKRAKEAEAKEAKAKEAEAKEAEAKEAEAKEAEAKEAQAKEAQAKEAEAKEIQAKEAKAKAKRAKEAKAKEAGAKEAEAKEPEAKEAEAKEAEAKEAKAKRAKEAEAKAKDNARK